MRLSRIYAAWSVVAALSGCGSNSNPLGLSQLDTTPPPAPTNIAVAADASGQPQLVWDASAASDVVGYEVQVFSAASGGFVTASDPNTGDTSYTLPGANVQATFRVRAVDGSGNWSSFSSADISTIPPASGNTPSPGGDSTPQLQRSE
jgi:hypothetical protein